MVMIYEYRIPLPFTVEEYEIAQLYMVAKFSASESSGDSGDGVEVLKNEPFEEQDRKGQYTHKIYHLASKLPGWMVSLLPTNALILEEEAWNAYPHCTTVLKCPFLAKFSLIVETTHLADRGNLENALNMDSKTLKKRQVEYIDIAMDEVDCYVKDEDPSLFRSVKTGRGPLKEGWTAKCDPMMCAYKSVTVDVPYWGFGSRIEKFIAKSAQRKILLEGHRKCFTWLDEWHGLTMDDVRTMEMETAAAMNKSRATALRKLNCTDAEERGSKDYQEGTLRAEQDHCAISGPQQRDATDRRSTHRTDSFNSRTSRQTSLGRSSAGPSFSRGISTISVTERDGLASESQQTGRRSTCSVPPWPAQLAAQDGGFIRGGSDSLDSEPSGKMTDMARIESCESFHVNAQLKNLSWDMLQYGTLSPPAPSDAAGVVATAGHASTAVAACMSVLDKAISWVSNNTKVKDQDGSLKAGNGLLKDRGRDSLLGNRNDSLRDTDAREDSLKDEDGKDGSSWLKDEDGKDGSSWLKGRDTSVKDKDCKDGWLRDSDGKDGWLKGRDVSSKDRDGKEQGSMRRRGAKALYRKMGVFPFANEAVTAAPGPRENLGTKDVDWCVNVLDRALAEVRKRGGPIM